MEAGRVAIKETVPASRKLQSSDARDLLKSASKLIVAKGKKVNTFTGVSDEAVAAMLGPTGNLRAPTLIVGKTLIVGFNDDAYSEIFG